MTAKLADDSINLLRELIKTPSLSREEDQTAAILKSFFKEHQIRFQEKANNVWAYNLHFDSSKPTILLNSHHDTVKPNPGYTRDPFAADIEDGKLYGLGSNDAGGALVSLIAAFRHFYQRTDLMYNLCLAATAEEEISGLNGIELILPELGVLDFAIVGEPTEMHLAIAEKGLMVLDCVATGVAGHAARDEGDNAIYKAIKDIEWFSSYRFPRESEVFGPIKMSVTIINAGSQHNVVPATCNYTVDLRLTDAYRMEEVLKIIKANVSSEVVPRSMRLKPSSIDKNHPIVLAGVEMGCNTYGSPTTSDQALLDIPSLKMGPGFSGRSHMADEYIYVREIEEAISIYITLLNKIIIK